MEYHKYLDNNRLIMSTSFETTESVELKNQPLKENNKRIVFKQISTPRGSDGRAKGLGKVSWTISGSDEVYDDVEKLLKEQNIKLQLNKPLEFEVIKLINYETNKF